MRAALTGSEPRHRWATWQSAAQRGQFSLWPILADLAARHHGEHDHQLGLTPDHYTH
ncbi:hypothetical protein QMK17_24650 [Rhodococcus sp. G-MC3]|uniref:hypothetical protein n=1 Tax=Rhodococcus sp. G-MC3 TaxID=3046209 RepID=UPI0024BB4760|nr:hypothetical protein [Rhodococcus sp. G-MC3]MDJ0396498.1 hypothetical protein [Rhodococcus sp. G-MC3]